MLTSYEYFQVKVEDSDCNLKIENGKDIEEDNSERDGDVMDRICHDLHYLLNGVKDSSDESEIPNILIQNTSL